MDLRTETTAREIALAPGSHIKYLYYPYINPPPWVEVNDHTKRRAIGVLENGDELFEYKTDYNKSLKAFCQEWLTARQAKSGIAVEPA